MLDKNSSASSLDRELMRDFVVNSNPNQFKILFNINDLCFGDCLGCSIENKLKISDIDFAKVEGILKAAASHINNHECTSCLFACGIGDYLAIDDCVLTEILRSIKTFSDLVKKPIIYSFTTSLLVHDEILNRRLEIMHQFIDKEKMHLEVVVDVKSKNLFDLYSRRIDIIMAKKIVFDLVLNLHPLISDEDVDDFIALNNDRAVGLDIALNFQALQRMPPFTPEFGRVIEKLMLSTVNKYSVANLAQSFVDESLPMSELVWNFIKNQASHGFAIDKGGIIYFLTYGFGDIILQNKIGQLGYVNFETKEFVFKSTSVLKREILSNCCKEVCNRCEFQKKCHGTGFGLYQTYGGNDVCVNPSKELFFIQGGMKNAGSMNE